jgi:uncharacterized membrane protein
LPAGAELARVASEPRISRKALMPVDDIQVAPGLGTWPLYAFLVQFPAVCFTGALLSDVVYWRAPQFLWETFSVWLLAVGCLAAALAGIVGLVGFCADRRKRSGTYAWPHALASLLVAVLSGVNALVHSRDGYTAVVPDGLGLSVLVVLLMVVVTWLGWRRPARLARAGVSS